MTNLKPFNLEQALAGEKVIDKIGREYVEFHLFTKNKWDAKSLICVDAIDGQYHYLNKDGTTGGNEQYLFMAPKTITTWIAIRKGEYTFRSKQELINFLNENGWDESNFNFLEIEIEE